MANVSIILRNAPKFRGALWLNEFTGQITVRKPLFGECDESIFRDRTWTDDDELAVTEWMQDVAEINATRNTVFDGVNRVASENRFHPVRDFLDSASVIWDGEPRIDNWLITYLGAKMKETDQKYLRVAGSRALISAVARIYRPGIKSDTCLMVLGDQGIGKSTLLRIDPLRKSL